MPRRPVQRIGAIVAIVAISCAVLLGVVGPPAPVAAAQAGAAGPCPGSSGVTVVVDFQRLGGGVVTRCAPGPQTDGLAALRAAGFVATPTTRFSGFVCRIDAKPGPADEACVDTPPYDAYWSYWTAPRGGEWTYSRKGAATAAAPEGSVQGWSFDDGTQLRPGIAPPAPAAPVTAPPTIPATAPSGTTPSSPSASGPSNTATAGAPSNNPAGRGPTAASGNGGTVGNGGAGGPGTATADASTTVPTPGTVDGSPATAAPAAAVLGTSETAPPADDGSGSTTTVDATTTTGPITVELASGRSSTGGGGSPIPTIVTIGLVVAIGVTAFSLRRRRSAGTNGSS